MGTQYKNILKILEKWPIDPTKKGRDIGEHIRTCVKAAFNTGVGFRGDLELCDLKCASLKRLSDGYHANSYKRTNTSSATGLSFDECKELLKNETLDYFQKENRSMLTKLKDKVKGKTQRSYFKLAQALEYRDHNPVMVDEVLKYMNPESTHTIIDMTFGAGGHSLALLEKNKDLIIVALDRDPVGYEKACSLAVKYPTRIIPLLGKFSELPKLMHSVGLKQNSMDGVLFDFGCSSMQFDTADRGFSISKEGPLDMRMDGNRYPDQLTAMDILERAPEEDLARIFRVYGEEKQYKKIARGIVESRYLFRKLETTTELADLISSICDGEIRFDKLDRKAHCATKVFQALRIFVNDELNEINHGMHVAKSLLKIGGRLITISFHSLEDTIIKRHLSGNLICDVANPVPLKYSNPTLFHDKESIENVMDTCWKSLTKHVVIPSTKEVESNPRSRSAKLRAAVKVK